MGVFSFLGKNLVRPYATIARDLRGSVTSIKDTVGKLQADKEDVKNVEYVEAPDGKKAFDTLYAKNNWTEPELATQRVAVRRTKWVCMTGASASIVLFFVLGLTSTSVFFTLFSTAFCALATALFSVRSIQYAIFQTQIEERFLITYREFMSRQDFWKRVFS